MSILRTFGGWGIVLFGTIVMGIGYVLSLSAPIPVGITTTAAVGAQMTDTGFTLVIAGFAGWIIVYILRVFEIV